MCLIFFLMTCVGEENYLSFYPCKFSAGAPVTRQIYKKKAHKYI